MSSVASLAQSPSVVHVERKKPHGSVQVSPCERHYSIIEIAKMWCLSERTVRRIFAHEAGVMNWGHAESRRKRKYQTLRIPESVLMRVYQRIQQAG